MKIAPKIRSDEYVKSMIRRMLADEGWVRVPVIVIGPDCQPVVLEDTP